MVPRERESGRLPLLVAMSSKVRPIWWTRELIRTGLVSAALLVPFIFAALREGASLVSASLFGAVVLAYLVFCFLLVRGVGTLKMSSAAHAGALVATRNLGPVAIPSRLC